MQRREKVADRAGSLVSERVRGVIETAQARAARVRRDAADEAHRLDKGRMQAASRIVSQVEELQDALGRLRQQMQAEHTVEGSIVDEGRLIDAVADEGDEEPDDAAVSATSNTTAAQVQEAEVEQPEAVEVQETEVEVVEEPEADGDPVAEVEDATAEDELPEPDDPFESDEPAEVEDAEEPTPDTATTKATATTKVAEQPEPAGDGGDADQDKDATRSRFSFRRRGETQVPDAPAAAAEEEPAPDQKEDHTHACAVCSRGFAGNADELRSLGWVTSASGEVTCADCHSAGWLRPGN